MFENEILRIVGEVSFYVTIFLVAILFHEGGHFIMLKKFNPNKVKIKIKGSGKMFPFGFVNIKLITTSDLSNQEYRQVLTAGIILGVVPIVLVMLMGVVTPVIFIILLMYMIGCWKDFKALGELEANK